MLWGVLILVGLIVFVHVFATLREARAEAAYPPSGAFVDVDGTAVHYRITGEGPDLVIIHGASGSIRDLTFAFAERMAQSHRVVLFDRPGLGWTERPTGYGGAWNTAAESPEVQARLLQGAADKIGVQKPIVMGHSYGGSVALAWALARPEDTAAVVMAAGVANPWPGNLGLLYQVNSSLLGSLIVIPAITAFAPQPVVDGTVREIFSPQDMPTGYLAHFGDGMTLRRKTLRANAQQVNNLRPHIVEMSQRYSALKMPVEIVHGDADTIVPLDIHARPLFDQIEGARLTVLEGIGHMPQHVAADALDAAIQRATQRAGLR